MNKTKIAFADFAKKKQMAEFNPNWKGGKSKTSHGYMIVRNPEHFRALSNGYVYEHILVMENKLGRLLIPGEQVHHIDGNKTNNNPDNLELCQSRAHHFLKHRKNHNLRIPGESNIATSCLCGCGILFPKYDSSGRPRKFVSGHNMYLKGKSNDKILE